MSERYVAFDRASGRILFHFSAAATEISAYESNGVGVWAGLHDQASLDAARGVQSNAAAVVAPPVGALRRERYPDLAEQVGAIVKQLEMMTAGADRHPEFAAVVARVREVKVAFPKARK
jgi:hypothetical protein